MQRKTDTPEDHLRFLTMKTDTKCFISVSFTTHEFKILKKYACWMDALATGQIKPYTDAQSRFVKVTQGELEPISIFEQIWVKYNQIKKERIKAETDHIRKHLYAGTLSWKTIGHILAVRGQYEFTDEEIDVLNQQMREKQPRGISPDSLIVYSSTDGQD